MAGNILVVEGQIPYKRQTTTFAVDFNRKIKVRQVFLNCWKKVAVSLEWYIEYNYLSLTVESAYKLTKEI